MGQKYSNLHIKGVEYVFLSKSNNYNLNCIYQVYDPLYEDVLIYSNKADPNQEIAVKKICPVKD